MPGPVITYPGVTGVVQLDGVNPVGISPGQFVLVCHTDTDPDDTGTLTVGDGVNASFAFPNCFREHTELVVSGERYYRAVRLLDRRYRLMMGSPVHAHFNQIDERKKLIPWTVMSPYQIALWLAAAGTGMGETLVPTRLEPESTAAGFDVLDIDLPGGLAQPEDAARGIPAPGPRDTVIRPGGEFYRSGTNAPTTNTNPTWYWNGTPAAVAMQALCEQYGRLFCPDPTTSSQSTVWPIGSGTDLPAGGVRVSDGISKTADPKPANVKVRYNPTRYQVRLRLRPVMPEWDGTWLNPEMISYAPARAGQAMRVLYRIPTGGAFDNTKTYGATVNTVAFTSVTPANIGAACTALAAAINASVNPLMSGISATVVGGNSVRVVHATAGVEFEATTTGSSAGLSWEAICEQGPISGPRSGQPVYEITYVGTWAVGKTLSVTIDGTTYTSPNTLTTLDAAVADLADQVNGGGLSVTSEWAPGKLLITGNAPGTAIVVAAAATGGGITVTNVEVAGTTFTPKGWERFWPGSVAGWFGVATSRLTLDQVRRLVAEHLCRTYQVVCVNPDPFDANGIGNKIPIDAYAAGPTTLDPVSLRHLIVVQNSRPEPVDPAPERISALDPKTGQPVALETYNGYATDRANVAYGSVWSGLITETGLLWTGGTYLGQNTPLRSRLPFPFRVIDPQHQVIQFDRPLFRILGQGAGTAYLPAELVIEVGATVLDPNTYSPQSFVVTVNTGGFGPDIERVLPDVEQEVVPTWDAMHRITSVRVLNQDAAARATTYGQAVGDTYQNAAGQARRYSGIFNVGSDGKTRVVNWAISGDTVQTAVGVNCEISRVILPLPARRKAEALAPDAVRAAEAMATDFKRWHAFANAMKWIENKLRGTQ